MSAIFGCLSSEALSFSWRVWGLGLEGLGLGVESLRAEGFRDQGLPVFKFEGAGVQDLRL